jgi:hypothetical protein
MRVAGAPGVEPNPNSFYKPVPDNETGCGLPAALSVTFNVAARVPAVVGIKVTLIVQLALAANELPQVWVCA